MSRVTAPVVEMFASLQGEGLWVGVPQLFVRLAGCDLECCYCDTAHARQVPDNCEVHHADGQTYVLPNPLSVAQVMAALNSLMPDGPKVTSVAVTGGEPLLHPQFVAALADAASDHDLRVYLETAGHLPEALAQVIGCVDVVAGDIKLPSTMSEPVPVEQMRRFWEVARGTDCFAKIVVTDRVSASELSRVCAELGPAIRHLPVVLQPVTAVGPVRPPDFRLLWRLVRETEQWFASVRVIPQCHQLMGAR